MIRKWWKENAIYQIYPRSFKDSNGDGIGDFQGIISKLDYLQELGIGAIWLCPIYESPNFDNGYDISNFQEIMKDFGTMQDFDEFMREAHERGIKIVLDMVLNHTSDKHDWFVESRSSIDNPKRDYYIWRKGKNGGYPNNWESYFSGSVWEYDQETEEYYMHLYARQQPDLNWENKAVVNELHDMIRWWMDKGVDGFRLDAIAHIVKAVGLPDADNPQNLPVVQAFQFFSNLEKVHTLLKDLNQQVFATRDLMTVGETSGLGPEQALEYVGNERHELDMVFQFEHMHLDCMGTGSSKWIGRTWNLLDIKKIMSHWQTVLHGKGWNANYFSNHDQPRHLSRFGNTGEYRKQSAKMLATLTHLLQGTPYIYQGEEIGMTNASFERIEDYRDVETINYYNISLKEGKTEKEILQNLARRSRDNARTPMQWDNTTHAGFTDGNPWIQVNSNYTDINVEQALNDPDSIFYYYKNLIALRKKYPVVIYGDYRLLCALHHQVYSFIRSYEGTELMVIMNFFDEEPTFELSERISDEGWELVLSNYDEHEHHHLHSLPLRPYETRVYYKNTPSVLPKAAQ